MGGGEVSSPDRVRGVDDDDVVLVALVLHELGGVGVHELHARVVEGGGGAVGFVHLPIIYPLTYKNLHWHFGNNFFLIVCHVFVRFSQLIISHRFKYFF